MEARDVRTASDDETGVANLGIVPETIDRRRPTGLSLAAIILASGAFLAVTVLHLLRTDLDPVREVMSGYANGSFGIAMTIAFYSFGLTALVMSLRLPRAVPRSGRARAVTALLAIAGLGLIVAGVFEVERPLVPDTVAEVVHSYAAIAAFLCLVAAMVLFAGVCRRDPHWRGFFSTTATLATVAVVAAALSPIADKTPWSGLAQRGLALTVFTWLLLAAVRIRFRTAR